MTALFGGFRIYGGTSYVYFPKLCIWTRGAVQPAKVLYIECQQPFRLQYLYLRLDRRGEALTLCEFEVVGGRCSLRSFCVRSTPCAINPS